MNSENKLFLFDIDGVLNTSEYFTVKYESDFGVASSEFHSFFKYDFSPCLTGHRELKELLPTYLEQWKWKGTIDEFITYWFQHDIKLDLALLKIIAEIRKKYSVGIASNQEKNRAEYLFYQHHLSQYFDYFYWSYEIGYLKDNSEFYKPIMNSFQGEIYFWDDSIENVKCAVENGIHAFQFQTRAVFHSQLNSFM